MSDTTRSSNVLSILKTRQGITPVIAIVLLLMMTVAAAGGAYLWITQLQGGFQDDAQEAQNREISLESLTCANDGSGNGVITAFLKNSGQTELSLNQVDVRVIDQAPGQINATLTRTGVNLESGSYTQDSNTNITTTNAQSSDIVSTGTSAEYTIELTGDRFQSGNYYDVEFVFTNEDEFDVSMQCQAD